MMGRRELSFLAQLGRRAVALLAGDADLRSEDLRLRSLTGVSPLYFLPSEPLGQEVLIPAFRLADRVDCMSGFFSSQAFASLAPGLATYINCSTNGLRLIISPLLRPEDKAALEAGVKSSEDIARETVQRLIITEDLLAQHTLRCLSWLVKTNRIEIKIALLKDALFHAKVWLFECGDDIMAVHGSSNLTYAGIEKNVEQVAVSQSWRDTDQAFVTRKLRQQFDQLWNGRLPYCIVTPLPAAVRNEILRAYDSEHPPREEELQELYERARRLDNAQANDWPKPKVPHEHFSVPGHLNYQDGAYAHQGKAVKAWCDAGYRGILEMATGSGKTITAMICAHRLFQVQKPLLIVVAAPYLPLIQQWCQEISMFGLNPVNLSKLPGPRARANVLNRLLRQIYRGARQVAAIVVSHKTLCSPEFQKILSDFTCPRLLIADEAHNLGSEGFTAAPPEFFEYRLGLSATPVRQYDDSGTAALFAFFGEVVFRFTLKEAIGTCLVEYDYFVHPVHLTEDELDSWYELTHQIKANAWRSQDGEPDEYLSKLLRDRRAILENARNKISVLEELLLRVEPSRLKHTLIYASDKNPEQLEAVNSLLQKHGILFHQLTHEETGDPDKTARIIRSFQEGTLRVLTAKRVLDEGVNIPQISRAYILASTTVERQWIQRRGRLLRRCPDIGKTHSEIHDFVALPPNPAQLDAETRQLIRSELARVQEFASLARNAGRPDGPLSVIDQLVHLAFT